MMKLHLRTSLTFLLSGFVLGFFTSFFIFGCSKSESKAIVTVQKAKEIKKKGDTIDVSYQKQIETLQDQNIELQQELEVSQGLLQEAKQDVQDKEGNVEKLLKSKSNFLGRDVLKKSTPQKIKTYLTPHQRELLDFDNLALFKNDDLQNPSLCDSLKREIKEYIEANHRKDSVYELQLITFDSVLQNKDLVIDASQKAYDNLKQLFDQSLSDQTALQKENKKLRASISRRRFQSKALTASLIVLSGLAVGFFVHH